MKYDYFLAGRWRNHKAIQEVLDAVRAKGKTAYCFIENSYYGDGITLDANDDTKVEQFMHELETVENWRQNPTFRKIFEADMQALKDSEKFILVLPAGLSGHMEFGAAYGLGKKCYGIGKPEKHETLYLMFDEIYEEVNDLVEAIDES